MWARSRKAAVSRHLYVVPKSDPIVAAWTPKTKTDFLDSIKRNPRDHMHLGASFVPSMDPLEMCRVVKKLRRSADLPKNFLIDLRESIIVRTAEISGNFTLKELVYVHRFIGNSRLDDFLRTLANHETVQDLSTTDLIYLIKFVREDCVADELARRTPTLSSYEMATVVNEFSKLMLEDRSSVERLLARVARRIPITAETMTARDCALLSNSFARSKFGSSHNVWSVLASVARERIDSFTPQGAALLVHAFVRANMATENSDLFTLVEGHLKKILRSGQDGKTIGLVLYSFGKAELLSSDDFLKHMSELVKRNLQSYDFRSIASISYGFSRLRFVADKELWRLISDEVVFRGTENRHSCRQISPTDVAMIAKAFSRTTNRKSPQDSKLGYVLYQLLKRSALTSESSTIVEVMEAFKRLPQHGGTIQAWVNKHLLPQVGRLTSIELVSVISSVGKLGVVNKYLNEALILNANRISDPHMRVLAAARLAKLKVYNTEFAKTSMKLISANLASFDLRNLITALFAFSEMNHREELFVNRLIQAVRHQLKMAGAMKPRALSTLAVSASRLRVTNEAFHEELMSKMFESIDAFDASEQCVCNTLFAMASAFGSGDWKDSAQWFVPVANSLIAKLPDNVSVEGIRQLQVLRLTLTLKHVNLNDPVSVSLLEKVEQIDTFSANKPSIEQSSPSHREISKLLAQLGLQHRNEATIGPFSLDIYVPDSKIAIEIDGPHHFFRESDLRTSSSVLKHSILEFLGYQVMHVPFYEWIQCTSDAKKLAYCSDIVQKAKLEALANSA